MLQIQTNNIAVDSKFCPLFDFIVPILAISAINYYMHH